MHARIVQEKSWPEIEDQFTETFGNRSMGGLTSFYYRVRKDWGLESVSKGGGLQVLARDKEAVMWKARNFSTDLLVGIGYLVK